MTILTPTFNRAYILPKAFESLCKQTDFGFEWIIVDDGSTDNTELIVRDWLSQELPFSIRYFKQKNGGKHRAVNKGVSEAKYGYILILDSDDCLTCDAVEKIHGWIRSIDGMENFAGVAGLRGWINKPGSIGGNGRGDGFIDAKNTERRQYNLAGDKAEIYKTEILKKYPFPEFEGENFLSERVVWDAISRDGYKLRWFSCVIYLCEYLEDGLTKSEPYKLPLNNFRGFTVSTISAIENDPFPWNYLAVGIYAHVAEKKCMSKKEIKATLSVSSIQLSLGKSVFLLNKMRKIITKK